MATEASRSIPVNNVPLDEESEKVLSEYLATELGLALDSHSSRVQHLSKMRRAYKKRPEVENKSFPWPGASNVVVPLVQITVDAIVARLMKAILATQDLVEVQIKSAQWEPLEKDFRDWWKWFFAQAGIRDRLRTVFHDMALCGDALVKPIWVEKKRIVHAYDAQGDVTATDVTDYVGPTWDVPAADDVVVPVGFDEWDQLPWFAQRLRYTRAELKALSKEQDLMNLDKVINLAKERDDQRGNDAKEAQHLQGRSADLYDVYEIWGLFEVPKQQLSRAQGQVEGPGAAMGLQDMVEEGQGDATSGAVGGFADTAPVMPLEGPPQDIAPDASASDEEALEYQEVIVLWHHESQTILRCIFNPFFGKSRYMMKVPYLVQAHELFSMGVAEQVYPNQIVASTVHNQVIDAATAANAGILVKTPDTNMGDKEEIYPGKVITDPNPQNVRVIHLSSPEPALSAIEERTIRYAETSSGTSSYHLGMESTIIGSHATATGTTALINEGNIRFWVSIDDMREALTQCIYLTISLIQQYQPNGVEIAPGKIVKFPPGDVRTSMGLNFKMTSETLNKDLELQNLQVLMQMLNTYYQQVMQAAAIVFNPQFPPEHKAASMAIMDSAHDIMKRFVERFEVESVDTIVPNLMQVIQQAQEAARSAQQQQQQPGMGPAAPVSPVGAPPAPGVGAPALA